MRRGLFSSPGMAAATAGSTDSGEETIGTGEEGGCAEGETGCVDPWERGGEPSESIRNMVSQLGGPGGAEADAEEAASRGGLVLGRLNCGGEVCLPPERFSTAMVAARISSSGVAVIRAIASPGFSKFLAEDAPEPLEPFILSKSRRINKYVCL